jgi:hypothetical protein
MLRLKRHGGNEMNVELWVELVLVIVRIISAASFDAL